MYHSPRPNLPPMRALVPVILAGGSGTRLWPVSTSEVPKQFQRLLGDATLFEQTLARVDNRSRFAAPIIVTRQAYSDLVTASLEGLGIADATIVEEPAPRNTAAAIATAARVAEALHGACHILVLPSDHLIRDIPALHRAIISAQLLAQVGRLPVTFGIEPDRPETGFGYVRAGEPWMIGGFTIAEFIEKPDSERAVALLRDKKVYWNSGMFLFPTDVLAQELCTHAPDILNGVERALRGTDFRSPRIRPAEEHFLALPDVSIDVALMEQVEEAAIVPVDPGWSDLGAWSAVQDVSPRDGGGNTLSENTIAIDCDNCLVRSDAQPVAVVGLRDVVVVASDNGILVADPKAAQAIRMVPARVADLPARPVPAGSPEAVTRPWGQYACLDSGSGFKVKRITVAPGGRLSLQSHRHRSEHWTIVAGCARVTVGSRILDMVADESVYIPAGEIHRLENLTCEPVELIEVQTGTYFGEDDITRYDDIYGRSDAATEPALAAA